MHQIIESGCGSIYFAKGFGLLEAEARHTEVTPRGLHLVQRTIDCLGNIVTNHIGCPSLTLRRVVADLKRPVDELCFFAQSR
ncbi:hypothetical protein LRP30_07535 [Bradyrhizobium sp. C-145]|uniref:hypothetical protein n=1 Tax=Bradyrhizobium sp. C-145 TaxID=574727 RepID=UPI00201B6264|nr:hypothetical protein [Bradyrhizobium sp. C-145]UQR65097.1 hypothetical protein LRP30_07535 [Bradyrhizobium sp. C-145]